MILDVPTLMLAGGFVGALCGTALLFVWWNSREPAALWWAAGYLAVGSTVTLLAIGFVTGLVPLIIVGLTLNVVAPAAIWSGIRVFRNRPLPYLAAALGLLIWLATVGTLGLHTQTWILPVCNTLLVVAFNAAAVWELARRGTHVFRIRRPLIALIAVNIVVFLMAVPDALLGNMQHLEPAPLASLFGLIHFETIIYLIGTTISFIALMREKTELSLLRDAQTDALTGLANRRAFDELADRVAERCQRQQHPIAAVVFDLDHFKKVNDTYGHAFGDEVLKLFAQVVREALRPGDVVGRVGGEEFFAVLPDTSLSEGCAVADRVRSAFAAAAVSVSGRDVQATVSAGVTASSAAAGAPLAELFEDADAALYRAKINGRNRVECAERKAEDIYPRLVRVA